ncbi:MAG: sensor histidine kinase [Flavisolibacter sp.]
MLQRRNIKGLPILMALTIIAIAAFQYYWLKKAFERENRTLEMRTNILFRETVRNVQASHLKLDRIVGDTGRTKKMYQELPLESHFRDHGQKMAGIMDVMAQRIHDSLKKTMAFQRKYNSDSDYLTTHGFYGRRNRVIQFLFDLDSLQDSIKVKELYSDFSRRINEQNLNVPFKISRVQSRDTDQPIFNQVTLGFVHPISYRLDLQNVTPFLLRRISIPILFSVFLVAFTILSFFLLYRNLIHQRKLANIKNDFISNITHELKTPIATVSVAIEALRSFNDNMDPEKTREYLDISANELQRLSLLVDKVLKLSMFEKKEIDLKYELMDMKDLVSEVTSSMRLQFEKHHAKINISSEGDTSLRGDRLHLVSVLFNLFDNALKYSSDSPQIDIQIKGSDNKINLIIADSGIGIPQEYQNKIFEKFFRVPTGNLHNAKGYGLGLSYVAHVINRHKGNIKVESAEGDGSRFIINLPKAS